jgi:hypothetical protein
MLFCKISDAVYNVSLLLHASKHNLVRDDNTDFKLHIVSFTFDLVTCAISATIN